MSAFHGLVQLIEILMNQVMMQEPVGVGMLDEGEPFVAGKIFQSFTVLLKNIGALSKLAFSYFDLQLPCGAF